MSTPKPALPASAPTPAPPEGAARERKATIVHLIQSLESGGCENQLLRLLPRIPTFDHRILTLSDPGVLAPQFEAAGIPVESVHLSGLLDIRGYQRLSRALQRTGPNLIVTYLSRADIIGRLILTPQRRWPILPALRTTYDHPRFRIMRLFERLTRRLVKRYWANSEAVKEFYVSRLGVPAEKVTVVPNGIDVDVFAGRFDRVGVRKELNLPESELVITCVGNLHPYKGQRYLIEAFAALRKVHPDAHLLLVGDGEEAEALHVLAESLRVSETVHFLGKRSDVPAILTASDIFALLTDFEGMSNAVMEAMAAGLACVVSDIPPNRQLIRDGKEGLLVPARDSQALVAALEELAGSDAKRRSFGDHARARVRETYAIDHVAVKVHGLFERMIQRISD